MPAALGRSQSLLTSGQGTLGQASLWPALPGSGLVGLFSSRL